MIPFFEKEIAIHHWTAAADYPKMIAIAQIFPGPFAIDSSAYIGYQVAGIAGAIVSSCALSLPSFLILTIITRFYSQFKTNPHIQIALSGVRPVIIGLLISAAYIIGVQPLLIQFAETGVLPFLKSLLLIIAGYMLLKTTKINPLLFILIFGIAGLILF